MSAQHPLILDEREMFAHPNFVGTCDWGRCDHLTSGLRWSSDRKYLSACHGHLRHRDCRSVECNGQETR